MIKIKFYALISKNIAFWPPPDRDLLENENQYDMFSPRHLVARLEGWSPTPTRPTVPNREGGQKCEILSAGRSNFFFTYN